MTVVDFERKKITTCGHTHTCQLAVLLIKCSLLNIRQMWPSHAYIYTVVSSLTECKTVLRQSQNDAERFKYCFICPVFRNAGWYSLKVILFLAVASYGWTWAHSVPVGPSCWLVKGVAQVTAAALDVDVGVHLQHFTVGHFHAFLVVSIFGRKMKREYFCNCLTQESYQSAKSNKVQH